jgi:hypothetical protein
MQIIDEQIPQSVQKKKSAYNLKMTDLIKKKQRFSI